MKQIEKPDNIISKINEGLESSTHFLLIWSKNAKLSKWVKRKSRQLLSMTINI